MKIPYLQVSEDIFDRLAPELSAHLGIEESAAGWLVLKVWKYALSRAGDAPPDGLIYGDKATAMVERAIGWTGEAGVFVGACVHIGLIEGIPGGLRIRGLDRYKRTWEKNRRNRGHDALRPGTFPAPNAPGTGTKTAPKVPVDGDGDGDGVKTPLPKNENTPREQVAAPSVKPATERVGTCPTPGELVALWDGLYSASADGAAFPWTPAEEQALKALAASHGEKLPSLLRTAAAPGFKQWASLQALQRGGSEAVAQLRQKATAIRERETGPPRSAARGRATEADKQHNPNAKVIRHADGFEELDLAD